MSQAMESFLRDETTEQLIARCVRSSVNPDSVEFHRADGYSAARSLDETERLLEIRTQFFIGFFCERHREWRVTAYIPFVIQHMVTVDEPDLTDDKVLQGIQDLRQVGKLGEHRTQAQVAEDQKEADRLAILRDLAERKELIDRLMVAQPKNNPRLTRIDDIAFAQTREVVRKEYEQLSTERLRQRVANIEGAARLRSMSYEELRRAARNGEKASTVSAPASTPTAKRRSPNYTLPTEYSADRLRKMSQPEMAALTRFPDGRPRLVGGTNDDGAPICMRDAVLDRLSNLS